MAQLLSQLNELYRVDYIQNVHPQECESIRLSPAIEEYIQNTVEMTKDELMRLPVVSPQVVPDSLPLTHYFVSSSHNTYLLSRQVAGRASPESYTHALSRGARCVEIDVWPSSSPEGLVVTHGYTLSKGTSFKKVCEAIGAGVDALGPDAWPVLVSLENHVSLEGQKNMINIMRNAWGEKLVVGQLNGLEEDVEPSPADLKGRIILMVEYYSPTNFAENEEEFESEMSMLEQERTPEVLIEDDDIPEVLVGKVEQGKISDELAALGYYARSWKPSKDWLQQELKDPRHILINISESSITSLLPAYVSPLIEHARAHLRRIFPRGTRIRSSNMDILKFWRNGSHIVSMNMQTADLSMEMNEAMFVGSPGWVLKPHSQRSLGEDTKKLRLNVEVVGISSAPLPNDHQIRPFLAYLKADLFHERQDQEWKSKTIKTTDEGDAMWNQSIEWEFDHDELAFLRIRVRESRRLKGDVDLAVFCARVVDIQQGWHLIHMFHMDGKASGMTLLAKFMLNDICK